MLWKDGMLIVIIRIFDLLWKCTVDGENSEYYLFSLDWKINFPSFSIKTGSDMDIGMSLDERLEERNSKLEVDPVGGEDMVMLDDIEVDAGLKSGVKSTVIFGIGNISVESLFFLSSRLSSLITMLSFLYISKILFCCQMVNKILYTLKCCLGI